MTETEHVAPRRGRSAQRAVATAGSCLSLIMVVGALGPWVRTPILTFSGWAGLGIPLILLSFAALGIQVAHAVAPRRLWLAACAAVSVLGFLGATLLAFAIGMLGGFSGLVAVLVARGAHGAAFSGQTVSVAWGLWLFILGAFLLGALCLGGLVLGVDAPVRRSRPSSDSRRPYALDPGLDAVTESEWD